MFRPQMFVEFIATAKAALADSYDGAAFLAALNAMEPDEAWAVTVDDDGRHASQNRWYQRDSERVAHWCRRLDWTP